MENRCKEKMPHHSGRDFTEKEKRQIKNIENPVPYKEVESWRVIHRSNMYHSGEDKWYASVAPAGDSYRPWKGFSKKAPAVKYARKKAKENDGELIITNKDGRKTERNVYL